MKLKRLITTILSCLLWMYRQNEDDIVSIYNLLTPYVRLVTNCDMLNFGYWNADTKDLFSAQRNLSSLVGELAELHSGLRIIDAGSGFSSPALYWESKYCPIDIICVDTNNKELRIALEHRNGILSRRNTFGKGGTSHALDQAIRLSRDINSMKFINANSTLLPFASQSVDRVIALESAHHFRPITQFIDESRRVLKNDSGILVIALPVVTKEIPRLNMIFKLGILYISWASQHYEPSKIMSLIVAKGFIIREILHVGNCVYEPLADYYIHNRGTFKRKIIPNNKFSWLSIMPELVSRLVYDLIERIIYHSALKMKELSRRKEIDYIIIKAELK